MNNVRSIYAGRAGQARYQEHLWRGTVRTDRAIARHATVHDYQRRPARAEHRGVWLLVCLALAVIYAMVR